MQMQQYNRVQLRTTSLEQVKGVKYGGSYYLENFSSWFFNQTLSINDDFDMLCL